MENGHGRDHSQYIVDHKSSERTTAKRALMCLETFLYSWRKVSQTIPHANDSFRWRTDTSLPMGRTHSVLSPLHLSIFHYDSAVALYEKDFTISIISFCKES